MAWTRSCTEGTEKVIPAELAADIADFRLPMVGFYRRACQHQCLPKAFETECIPLGLEDVSWHKISLLADLAPVHTAKTVQQLFVELWTLADWPPYTLDLNLLDFATWHVFQAKVLATPYAYLDVLHLSITGGMGLVSGRIHWQDLPLIPPLQVNRRWEKLGFNWIDG
jgi:hypothetical protein